MIVDRVLPNVGAPLHSALMDLSMMTFGGTERTERQWRELLESAGLNVVDLQLPKAESLSRDGTIVASLV